MTGRSGDGGIDGTGVLRVNLLSFHVNYQCKRYAGTVGPGSIRDFRGALAGRADKGLFITTGRFTKAPQSRSGASLPLRAGAASGPATPTLHGPTAAGRYAPSGVCSMQEAEREAVREGAMAIDLIDGVELCGLLRDKGLGVVTQTVERVEPDPGFFDTL